MRKCFILTQFGTPHSWTQQYIDNVQHLKEYGWEWKIFTSNKLESKGNVEIIPMDIEGFNQLMEKTVDINPHNHLVNGLPNKAMSDFYVASGHIFEDYLKDVDFWGITNWDIVYGRLDRFITDEMLSKVDVWSDDVNIINGIFTLMRNTKEVNMLYKRITDWEYAFKVNHLMGTDEHGLTDAIRRSNDIRFGYPRNYPMHSYDRLVQHVPTPQLERHWIDGSLWEKFLDTNPPIGYVHFPKGYIAREIPYFHFIRTKTWPM